MVHRPFLALLLGGLLLLGQAQAAPLNPGQVPGPLQDWAAWVLWNDPSHACPRLTGDTQTRPCVWPAILRLALDAAGGTFSLEVETFADQPVPLPGDGDHWPLAMMAKDQPVPVVSHQGRPVVWLPPGQHSLGGRFLWDRLPTALTLPPRLALVELRIDGAPLPFPAVNDQGQIWLSASGPTSPLAATPEDSLRLQVFRRLEEGVPMRLSSRLVFDIAGSPREIVLPATLPEGAIPMAIQSPLAARLDPDGRLLLQARPGRWVLDIQARYAGDRSAFPFAPLPAPWPAEEIWAYQSNPAIRLVEILDAAPVDPRQTELPEEWRSLPAFRLSAGVTLNFNVIQRGDPIPEPDRLSLRRQIWLDFDGQGYSVRDRIGGTMTQGWRLDAGAGMALGRVDSDGEPQSITLDPVTGAPGVEVRRGQLDLTAESRLPDATSLSATGWARDFHQVGAELNLPPGWRLFAALGVDQAKGSWLATWTLLDFFLVLVITLAMGRLYGWSTAALALVTLALIWQEPGAPQFVWLNLLAAIALERVLPAGVLARWVRAYRLIAILALAVIAIPFMADQLRLGLYPQLENPYLAQPVGTAGQMDDKFKPMAPMGIVADQELALLESASPAERGASASRLRAPSPKTGAPAPSPPPDIKRIDPDALTQTGPGMPNWHWHRVALTWQGPVQSGQELRLLLIPPAANLLLGILRVILILGLAFLLGGGLVKGIANWRRMGGSLFLVMLAIALVPSARAGGFPSPELLNELKARLLAPPDCHPQCAEITSLAVNARPQALRLDLEVDAQDRVGIPLPAQVGQWLPSQVEIDDQPARALLRDEEGYPWVLVEAGRHRVRLAGALPDRDSVALPLPLKPRRVTATTEGWRLAGVGNQGVPEVQLQLIREQVGGAGARVGSAAGAEDTAWRDTAALPPFLELERTLALGLSWRVETRLRRLTPADEPLRVEIPLLPREAVLTPGLKVTDGRLTANLPGGQQELVWQSQLEPRDALTLTAPVTRDWNEVWRLDASPLWHVEFSGLAPIHHQNPTGQWWPEWRPWAGETLDLSINRPLGAPGTSLTVDASELRLRPGDRSTEATLRLDLRASRGGRQPVRLPEGARLQSVTLEGVAQPIRLEAGQVLLPVHPGNQQAVLIWIQEVGTDTHLVMPTVGLGAPSVNATSRIELGPDRWVLWLGGPTLGPAVLFWSLIPLILLFALVLGRLRLSPASAWQWGLLLLGLSQAPPLGAILVVGWLLALAWRGAKGQSLSNSAFNLVQIGLVLLSLQALSALAAAVAEGLLGQPAMQIAGNGSQAGQLLWYQDRTGESLPQPWVISVPLWVYRLLMLAWALWLANSLLNWLRWGWGCFTAEGLWRKSSRRLFAFGKRREAEVAGTGQEEGQEPKTAGLYPWTS